MKLFRRSESRRVHVLNSRRKAFLQGGFKRRLHAEKLEDRSLMAADLLASGNAFWNSSSPEDVNGDHVVSPNDALIVINALNASGSRSLAPASGPVASGELASGNSAASSNSYLVDVNNDGAITPLDALSVINRLNKANGEVALMQVTVKAVAVGGTFASPALTTIGTGTDYDLVVSVKDLRTGGTGVFNASLDIAFDTSLTNLEQEEIQKIDLPVNTNGGTFRLSLGGNFTNAITFDTASGDPDTDLATTGRNIQTALNSLLGAGSVAVSYNGLGNPSFVVRFQGAFGNTNVALLAGDGANLTVSSGAKTITTTNDYKTTLAGTFNGDLVGTNPNLFLNSFRFGTKYPNKQNATPGSTQVTPGPFSGINDAGAFGDSAQLGPTERELFRVRMNSKNGGVVNFVASNDNLSVGSENEVYDLNQNLLPSQITLVQAATLTITQPVDAVNDTYSNVTEGASNVTLSPSPLANDTKTTAPALTISKVGPSATSTTTSAGGTITISADRLNLIYTPPSSTFNGPDTFNYTITDGTNVDTASVTINVQSVNNAPVVTIPVAAQTVAEKATKIFSAGGGNAITVSDVDAGTSGITATLTANHGILVPGSTPAGVVITGSGTSVLTLTGDQAKINQALDGLQLQADPANLTYNGPATLTVAVNDNGFSGGAVSTPKSDSKVINITITPVNDPPVNTVPPTQNTTDEDPLVFSTVIGNRFTIADIDAASGTLNVTVSVLNGKLVSGGATGGATITGSGTAALSIVGTLTQINTFFGSGTITYTSNVGFAGTDTLTILTNDNGNTGSPGALTDSDNVSIIVVPKVRPKALDDSFTVNETNGATVYSLDVLNGAQGADRPHDLFASTLLGISSDGSSFGTGTLTTSQGTLSINTHGTAADLTDDTLDFTPNADVFTDVGLPIVYYYKMNDTVPVGNASPTRGVDSIGVIRITVTNTPDAPVAVQDGPYAATEDILLSVNAASGVLPNDTDIDYHGAPTLTAVLVTAPAHASAVNGGSFTLNSDGSFTYKGDLNYNGPDSFTYKARDPNDPVGVFSNNITVVLNVAAVNDDPVGLTHAYNINEDTLLSVTTRATGVLNNATDVETAPANLTAELVSGPANALAGSFVFNADGTFTYQGRLNFSGSDSFTFRVVDDNAPTPGKSAITTVNLTVNPVNDAPVAVDDGTALAPIYTVGEGGTLTIAAPGVVGNDTDVDLPAQTLRAVLVTTTSNGTLTLNSNGSFTYKPNKLPGQEGFTGLDSFTYRANDGVANSLNIATVYINVIPFNDPPIANNDPSFSVLEDTLGTFNAVGVKGKGVLVNDTDVDSPTLTAQLVRGPAHALSFTLNSDGSFTYKAALNYNGPDSFTYKASDGSSLSNEATVSLTVLADNDPPPVMDDNGPDGMGVIMIKNFVDQPIDVLANDGKNNPDGFEVLTIGSISQAPAHGTATISGGVILYTPTPGYEGPDVLKYLARDPGGLTSEATVTINVVNFRPTDVTGKIYFDTNDNGVKDPAETRALQGVEVQLTGTDFQGVNVSLTGVTDLNGMYRFIGLRPGEYTVHELQPEHVVDGKEILVAPLGAALAGNDSYHISLPILGVAGGVNGLNFGERSVEGSFTGIADLLSSSGGMLGDGSVGVVLALDGSGSQWVSILDGWTNLASISISPTSNVNEAILHVTDIGGHTFNKTVYQIVPAGSPYHGRFRVMGTTGGTQMIRLEGTAADFGLNLTAAAGMPQPQGEMGSYAAGVDALMAQQNWV